MAEDLQLNVPLLRRRVPNLTVAARAVGLRPATVSNLCTGKIPVGRAEVHTLVTLAALAGCSLDELILRGSGIGMIETGIKVLDLFAPLVRGGSVGLVARPGLGQMVVLSELLRRLRQRGYATLVWLQGDPQAYMGEVAAEAEAVGNGLDQMQQLAASLRSGRDVLLAADRSVVMNGELLMLRERLQEAGARPITYVLVDARGETPDEEAPYGPLETFWRFDVDLAVRGLFPAVDPVFSTSTLLEGANLEATHLSVQQRARKLLRRYRELRALTGARGMEHLPGAEVPMYRRGERLEAFLSQPFYVAEPLTERPGEWVSVKDTLGGTLRILDGAADDLAVDQLKYKGRLE